jgi:hypothetical protein
MGDAVSNCFWYLTSSSWLTRDPSRDREGQPLRGVPAKLKSTAE